MNTCPVCKLHFPEHEQEQVQRVLGLFLYSDQFQAVDNNVTDQVNTKTSPYELCSRCLVVIMAQS